MMKKVLGTIGLVMVFAMVAQTVHAGMINYDRKSRRQGNTSVTSTTRTSDETMSTSDDMGSSTETKTSSWKSGPVKVRYKSEELFDFNSDGYLQRAEGIAYLQDVVRQVQTKGVLRINSDILKEYDANNDGSIDRTESKTILRDIGK
jgi:hypothetical protein